MRGNLNLKKENEYLEIYYNRRILPKNHKFCTKCEKFNTYRVENM
jgi:hypothetical protein